MIIPYEFPFREVSTKQSIADENNPSQGQWRKSQNVLTPIIVMLQLLTGSQPSLSPAFCFLAFQMTTFKDLLYDTFKTFQRMTEPCKSADRKF